MLGYALPGDWFVELVKANGWDMNLAAFLAALISFLLYFFPYKKKKKWDDWLVIYLSILMMIFAIWEKYYYKR